MTTMRKHTCPASKCETKVEFRKLMCPTHWGMVPLALQNKVYQTYRLRGRGGRYIAEHRNAILDATRHVNALLAQRELELQ